jgi:carboxyl-terminal processing protease
MASLQTSGSKDRLFWNVASGLCLVYLTYHGWSFYSSCPQAFGYLPDLNTADCIRQIESKAIKPLKPVKYKSCKEAVLSLGDKYADFFSKEQLQKLKDGINFKANSIGVSVIRLDVTDGSKVWAIMSVDPQSPAQKAGIKMGDIIQKIEGQDINNLTQDQVGQILLGPSQSVKLELKTKAGIKVLELKKEVLNLNNVIVRLYGDTLFIEINSFAEGTYEELRAEFEALKSDGKVKNIVLDLRKNTGGYVTEGNAVAGAFVPKGTLIVKDVTRKGAMDIYSTQEPLFKQKNVAIVTDGMTASASEVVIGALRDTIGAKVIGQQTYGKGVGQTIHTLRDGSAIKFTTLVYTSPKGFAPDGIGFTPDVSKTFGRLTSQANRAYFKDFFQATP